MSKERVRIERKSFVELERLLGRRFVRYSEITAFGVCIVLILIIFFHSRRAEKFLKMEEDPNLALSVRYIENILRRYPERDDLKYILAKKLADLGEVEKIREIIKELESSRDPEIRNKIFELDYQITKAIYFSAKNKDERAQIKERLESQLLQILRQNKDIKVLEKYYRDALSISMPRIAMLYAETLSSLDKEKINYWLKEALMQSYGVSDYSKAKEILERLVSSDSENRLKWLLKLAEMYTYMGKLEKSVSIYLNLMNKSKTYEEKKKFFLLALNTLLASQRYREVRSLIRTYAGEFMRDHEVAKLMIKSALSSNDPHLAAELSLKVLEGGR